jgi:CBS domain-containing protein
MSHNDRYLDAMPRHLGAAYYDSLHSRAATADVSRAVDQVADQIGEKPTPRAAAPQPRAGEPHRQVPGHHGRTRSRVRHVMTTDVVTVDQTTPFKEIARLLVERHISGVPVLRMVSRRDLLSAFLAPDADIARQVREVLAEALPEETEAVKVAVHGGMVTLTGRPDAAPARGQVAAAIELIWNLDGVVDVLDHLSSPQPTCLIRTRMA